MRPAGCMHPPHVKSWPPHQGHLSVAYEKFDRGSSIEIQEFSQRIQEPGQ